jgi:hypothetical protein
MMIRENIKDLILAIADGDSVAIEDNFNTVMASKIADRLDDLRVSVAGSMFGAPVVEESYELDEEKNIEVIMKSGHKFNAPIKMSGKDWHIVKHPISGKQFRVDHSGNTLEESYELDDYSLEEIEEFMMSEEFEQLDELSKKTLGSYVRKSSSQLVGIGRDIEANDRDKDRNKRSKREGGIVTAVKKLTKEEVELDETREEHDEHLNATKEHLDKELNHKYWGVRYAAASHPNATKEHLDKALNDGDSLVRKAAASHPNATKEHLDKASNDTNPAVRRAAAENLAKRK